MFKRLLFIISLILFSCRGIFDSPVEISGEWTRYHGNPVLKSGPLGSWDSQMSTFASVIYDSLYGDYRMYYHGADYDYGADI